MRSPTMKTVRGTGAIKRVFVQLKGGAVPLMGPSVPLTGPLVPLTGALFNCLIVGHSPDFNCIGRRGASKNIGLGRT